MNVNYDDGLPSKELRTLATASLLLENVKVNVIIVAPWCSICIRFV